MFIHSFSKGYSALKLQIKQLIPRLLNSYITNIYTSIIKKLELPTEYGN